MIPFLFHGNENEVTHYGYFIIRTHYLLLNVTCHKITTSLALLYNTF